MRVAIAVALALLVMPAWAEDKPTRTVDMTQVLTDESGTPAPDFSKKERVDTGRPDPDPRCDQCPRLTLGRAVSQSLFAIYPEDKDAEQRWARAVLGHRVRDDPAAVLTSEEVTVIKRQMGKAFGGVVLMQAYPMLDPNAAPPTVK
jgi:hypothetical protein